MILNRIIARIRLRITTSIYSAIIVVRYSRGEGITRMKNHLIETLSNMIPCKHVPKNIKKQFLEMLRKKSSDVGLSRPRSVEVTLVSGSVNTKKGSLNYFEHRGANLVREGKIRQTTNNKSMKEMQ